MDKQKQTKSQERSIRIRFPKLYKSITEKLEEYNIHSYDIQINIIEEETQNQLILHYGEGYGHTLSQLFTIEQMNEGNPEIIAFLEENINTIKEIMVADYFKMMKV